MPSVKCVHCGYRIIVPAPTNVCPNCGDIFDASAPISGTANRPLSGTVVLPPPPSASPDEEEDEPLVVDASTSPRSAVSAAQPRTKTKQKRKKPRNPARPGNTSVRTQEREPDLRGIVIHQAAQVGVSIPQSGFMALFKILRDIIWPIYEPGRSENERKKNVTTIRVVMADYAQREARFEGDFAYGSIALGDEISVWGRVRKGVLWARQAYNHTSHAMVSTRMHDTASSGAVLFIIGICLLIGVLIFLKIGWLVLLPSPHFHISFGSSH